MLTLDAILKTTRQMASYGELTGSKRSEPQHEISERRSPVSVMLICSCGWRHTETRRQNARARQARLDAARRSHSRTITRAS